MTHVLLLGGTSEASALARALSQAGIAAVFSYAGATRAPLAQPLPTRCGGFGGVAGLVQFIRAQGITHVVDATHPFAAQMSRHACLACAETGAALLALERAPWQLQPGDCWHEVADMAAAAAALPAAPSRVFLAVGRKQLDVFAVQPQHHYLLRLVDAPGALPLPQASVVLGRGPFSAEDDLALLRQHRIEWVVAKNAGGEATRGKLDAARALGLPVVMVQRPALPARASVQSVAQVLDWLGQGGPGHGPGDAGGPASPPAVASAASATPADPA
ncbi:cobalt-precorrin-6A reductase [Allofranklinella schreckenbergeri]|uniref:Cobalt-precorrin-6A reductase n=1 Tax=Allofranklinella schreckenbergeri TaxID=1076744 RepID=A0A3M6Q7Q5_9BURK|nr:cobalt-precorrin-6A reductase [Allofranklinella schreckenbergeri]RMW99192.1 cobalt-precorrin-6A reductase [Allofranklinella schreckenbergeri]